MMGKIKRIIQVGKNIANNPRILSRLVDWEKERKEYLQQRYGYSQLPTIDILDLLPDLNEKVNNYSFLSQTSLITDIALLKALARRLKSCHYLEIGCWRGETIANVAEVAEECISISLSPEEMRQQNLSEEYINLHGYLSRGFDNITYIEHDSATFDFSSLNKKFDLIYIDGDHRYPGVKIDTQNAFRLLKDEQSMIVWHDYGFDPEFVNYETLAGILDGSPHKKRQNIYHVSNTMCAIYINPVHFNDQVQTRHTTFPDTPDKMFSVTVCAHRITKSG
jgi:SAM-dependent methyltransferase